MTIEAATVAIALRKLEQGASSELIVRPRLGTGGDFANVFFWDTAFTSIWARYYLDALPVTQSLDNLYRLQSATGLINREIRPNHEPVWPEYHPVAVAPPVLTWAELLLHEEHPDLERLREVYPRLARHHNRIKELLQANDGLYFHDALGCGMDNLPRWPHGWSEDGLGIELVDDGSDLWEYPGLAQSRWNRQGRWIDLSAQMALDAESLVTMAGLLDLPNEQAEWLTEREALAASINESMWDEKLGFYVDTWAGSRVPRLHIGGLWPLAAGIVPEERLSRLVSHLSDGRTFGSVTPVRTLAGSDLNYESKGDYWRGSSWAPTTYMVLSGLRRAGADTIARTIAEAAFASVRTVWRETGTLWENYAPDSAAPGSTSQPEFCGWSGLYSVAIPREFID